MRTITIGFKNPITVYCDWCFDKNTNSTYVVVTRTVRGLELLATVGNCNIEDHKIFYALDKFFSKELLVGRPSYYGNMPSKKEIIRAL